MNSNLHAHSIRYSLWWHKSLYNNSKYDDNEWDYKKCDENKYDEAKLLTQIDKYGPTPLVYYMRIWQRTIWWEYGY